MVANADADCKVLERCADVDPTIATQKSNTMAGFARMSLHRLIENNWSRTTDIRPAPDSLASGLGPWNEAMRPVG
jgi:hypothetical protein